MNAFNRFLTAYQEVKISLSWGHHHWLSDWSLTLNL